MWQDGANNYFLQILTPDRRQPEGRCRIAKTCLELPLRKLYEEVED